MSAQAVVDAFIAAIERKDIDAAVELLDAEVEYDNVPMAKIHGAEAVRSALGPMIEGCVAVEWPVHRQVADDTMVFNERLDRFQMGETWVEIPVTGVWEVANGKITLWRDYFDLATYTDQIAALAGD